MPINEQAGAGLTVEQITALAGSKPYKYDATTAPGVTNDINDTGASNGVGYEVGSVWIDTTANEAYRCVDNTDGAAIWINTTLTTDELGSMALQASDNVAITGGSVTGITDLAVADGGTGASTEAGARTNLDVFSKDETLSVDKYKVWTDWTIPTESSVTYTFLEHIDFVATAPFEMMVRIQGQAGTSLSHYASVGAYASTDEEIHRLLAAASTTITGTTGSGDSVTGTTRIVEGYRIKSQPDAGSHRIKFYVKAGTDRVQLAAALNVATTIDTFSSIELRYANQAIDDENLLFEDLTTATSATIQIDQRPATGMTNPMTTAGDIIVGGASGTPARLAMGTALQTLRVNSGGTALEYADPSGGSVSDTAYGPSWNGDTTTAPSKNAVYDRLEEVNIVVIGGVENNYPTTFPTGTLTASANSWGTRLSDYTTAGETLLSAIRFECSTGTETVKYFHGVPNGSNWDLTEIATESSVSFTIGVPHVYNLPVARTVNTSNDCIIVSLQGNGAEFRYTTGGSSLYTSASITTNQTNFSILTDTNEVAVGVSLTTGSVTGPNGIIPPSLTTAQRDAITSPNTGLTIYNTTTNQINFYNGSSWVVLTNPMTTAGDIIVGGASGTPARLAAGSDGQVLTLASGTPAWAAASTGVDQATVNATAIKYAIALG